LMIFIGEFIVIGLNLFYNPNSINIMRYLYYQT
jgi:hypothetical protein